MIQLIFADIFSATRDSLMKAIDNSYTIFSPANYFRLDQMLAKYLAR